MAEGMRYGKLEIAVTSRFNWIYSDQGSGANRAVAFYTPALSSVDVQQGWKVLAHVGRPNWTTIDRESKVIIARGVNTSDEMLKPPTRFDLIWRDTGSGGKYGCAVWRPIPPTGYVSLGDVVTAGDPPPAAVVACVRKTVVDGRSYVREAEIGKSIWSDQGSGTTFGDVEVWKIEPPTYPDDSIERLLLGADAFVAGTRYGVKPDRTVHVLDLPALIVKKPEPTRPVMTSHSVPEQETLKVVDRAVTVPCTVIKDPGKTADWQVTNSPFYTLERRVNYYRQMFYDNSGGSVDQPNSQSITTGVSTTESEEFSKRTSVTVSASVGVEIKAFTASVETSVTTELGYTSRYDVTVLKQKTDTWSMVTPARHSTALWSPRHEIVPIRKNGDVVGGQGGLKFDTDVRVFTQFPPAPGASSARVLVNGVEEQEDPKVQPFGESESTIPEALSSIIAS
ncbi:Vps62-related protein [Streptomyces hesseae]|uniref:Vps62-related protein n=1 Tax=Streptomyces hesseae TaxID=3075519 RepID=A0ABU2SIP2_9ACTN|nr:Vps62-related protein [Streptomyces sp. DSM 40473]MDT0447779.1 Vps62-related protein [Streptomyces sp. DSM 40473]